MSLPSREKQIDFDAMAEDLIQYVENSFIKQDNKWIINDEEGYRGENNRYFDWVLTKNSLTLEKKAQYRTYFNAFLEAKDQQNFTIQLLEALQRKLAERDITTLASKMKINKNFEQSIVGEIARAFLFSSLSKRQEENKLNQIERVLQLQKKIDQAFVYNLIEPQDHYQHKLKIYGIFLDILKVNKNATLVGDITTAHNGLTSINSGLNDPIQDYVKGIAQIEMLKKLQTTYPQFKKEFGLAIAEINLLIAPNEKIFIANEKNVSEAREALYNYLFKEPGPALTSAKIKEHLKTIEQHVKSYGNIQDKNQDISLIKQVKHKLEIHSSQEQREVLYNYLLKEEPDPQVTPAVIKAILKTVEKQVQSFGDIQDKNLIKQVNNKLELQALQIQLKKLINNINELEIKSSSFFSNKRNRLGKGIDYIKELRIIKQKMGKLDKVEKGLVDKNKKLISEANNKLLAQIEKNNKKIGKDSQQSQRDVTLIKIKDNFGRKLGR